MTHTNPNVRSDNEPLTQVAHEGNPVLFDLAIVGVLDGTPALVPPRLPGKGGGDAPILPFSGGGANGNCFLGICGTVTVTGGVPPYSFSTDVGTITVDAGGTSAMVCAGANPGSAENPSVVAFGKCEMHCCTFISCVCKGWNCNGDLVKTCGPTACNQICTKTGRSCTCASCSGCSPIDACLTGACAPCTFCCDVDKFSSACDALESVGAFADMRSDNGLSSDCQPCAIQFQNGAVVTVQDSIGNTILIPLEWEVNEV